jgi:hypothetical protein
MRLDEGTTVWPFSRKKSRKLWRISWLVGMVVPMAEKSLRI